MRDGIDEFGETAPDQADLIAIEEAREAWALTRSHGASDDPLSPPTPQNWGIQGVLRRAWDVAAGIWGSNPALICPYDDSGPSVRLVGCLNARAGCRYHEMLISVRFLKTAIPNECRPKAQMHQILELEIAAHVCIQVCRRLHRKRSAHAKRAS